MKQLPLCPSCLHRLTAITVRGMVFCTLEQALTHPHLVCRRFEPAGGADPPVVRDGQRRSDRGGLNHARLGTGPHRR